ncbi:hypothetical protein V1T76_13110 [Roseibium sp. FZY0029]|uniref:hypothetical protein n=1 Tax=Roseibium sp. FZY0029 TaxID=3116647 RepID=UPI002EC2D523|nr:hypothetical protein [Roseibium sp. FZY0029]
MIEIDDCIGVEPVGMADPYPPFSFGPPQHEMLWADPIGFAAFISCALDEDLA